MDRGRKRMRRMRGEEVDGLHWRCKWRLVVYGRQGDGFSGPRQDEDKSSRCRTVGGLIAIHLL